MEGKGESSKRTKTSKLSMAGAGVGIAVLLLSLTFTFLAVVPVTAAEEQVEVRVSAPEYVEEGGTFDVTLDISDVTDLDSGQFDLSFDSSVVNATNVTDGSVDGEAIPVLMWDFVDADTITVISDVKGVKGVSGSGYLAKIGFEVKGKGGEECVLAIANGMLVDKDAMEIPANWIDGELKVREEDEEEEEEEEVGEEVIPGSPKITAWKPAAEVVGNAAGESSTFNISVNQIADISWQINGTEAQTNESVKKAVFTKSAVIGTWNVSAIATNTTTGLSDMHMWIWSVTLTPAATVTPSPALAPGVTPMPTPTIAPGVTPTPKPAEKPKSTPTPKPIPKPAIPGFEAIFAIGVVWVIAYELLRKR